ncbi:MAG: EAL domain-containing protein, partial [Acidimicrobiia bacterium]|nr:EAL domain-containing protein [Acidimicrobiia bacterium]
MMVTIALVPILGLGWFAAGRVVDAQAHRREIDEVSDAVDDLIGLLRLGSSIADEKHWAYATDGLDEIGVPRDLVSDIVDIDPWEELENAQRELDQTADSTGLAQYATQIEALRSDEGTNPVQLAAAYGEVEAAIRLERDFLLTRIRQMQAGDELTNAVHILEVSAEVRDDTALQLANFFSLRFSSFLTTNEAMRQLIARDDRYRVTIAHLGRVIRPGSHAARALAAVDADPHARDFAREVASAIDQTLSDGAGASSILDAEAVFADADALASTFLAADQSVNLHMALVEAAADDIDSIASNLVDDAAADSRNAILLGIGVTSLALAAAIVGGRTIVVPLRRMSAVADAMRQGSLDERVTEGGPRELRSAGRAMNEAVAQLQLSESQALALARGDLDDPVLATPSPGQLGESLREAVAHLASSLTEREEFRRRLAHTAAHDGLTGLPNRPASLSHVNRAIGRASRTDDMVAVLFVDLDGFKQINETHGHPAGDRVLVQVAQTLAGAVRQSDVVGRLGADEFIVVAEPVADEGEVAAMGARLLDSLPRSVTVAGVAISISASIGIATSVGGASPDALVREADVAVAEAKRRGRGQIRFCDDALRSDIATRSSVERGLATAIENDELILHFQELVDARTEQPVSMEALVRWMRPGVGMVPPDDFIPVAEASDLIIALDEWVLRHAIAQLATWTDDPRLGHLTLGVNLSARHLGHPRLVDHVLGPLRAHGVDPRRLVIEVTETALLDDVATAAAQLATLQAHGVRIAIDDFGTGYTSLAHLRALPVDVLKIDRSFVANLDREDERGLVRMIIEVGHLFGMEIIAEGVETASEARELLSLGTDTLQGYHYSRPSPAHVLTSGR